MKLYFTLFLAFLLNSPIFAQSFNTKEIEPNTFQVNMKVDGLNREFLVHIPPSYQKSPDQNFPVVLFLHGGGGTGLKFYRISQWKEVGDRENIITVFPTAFRTCVIKDGSPSTKNYWMTEGKSLAVCQGTKAHDDVAFMKAIVAHLHDQYRVDEARIYASGFSNGMGMILSQLLIDMGDTFAAFAGVGSLIRQPYDSPNPVPVFTLVGQNDTHMDKWAGISAPMADVHELLDETELSEKVDMILETMKLSGKYVERDRPKYILRRYTETTNGGDQELRFGIIKDLGHVYPHGGAKHNDIIIAEVFWEFFKGFTL